MDITVPYNVPIQDFKFVVAVGFTLGPMFTRGQSILRFF